MASVHVFINTLESARVKRIYGISGDFLNGLTQTLEKINSMLWIHLPYEEVTTFAAGKRN